MAGIGFRLERLAVEGGLTGGLVAVFTGSLLASGHWLLTIFGIGVAGMVSQTAVTAEVAEDFRLITIYSFGIASVTSVAILLPATRQFSDALYQRRPEKAPPLLFVSLAVTGITAALLAAIVFGAILGQPAAVTLTGIMFSSLIAMIWTMATYCSAVFAVRAVLVSYFVGTLAGLAAAIFAGFQTGIAWVMSLAYAAGLSISLGALIPIFLAAFPFPIRSVKAAITEFLGSLFRFGFLLIGALWGALAIWASTLVIWLSSFGETSASNFRVATLYDTPHFFGLLALIPGFALLIVFFETSLFRGLKRHYSLLEGHAPLEELEESAKSITSSINSSVLRLTATQILIAIALVTVAPLAAQEDFLQSRHVSVMQITALGTVMHLIIILSSVVLIYLDATRLYCLVQGAFLFGTVASSILALQLGERYFGIGYLVGASVGAFVAVVAIQSVMTKLNSHIFMSAAKRFTRPQIANEGG